MAAHPSGERFTVELEKGTNWWGAFVIGLAGTILVIGLAGYAVLALGGVAATMRTGCTGNCCADEFADAVRQTTVAHAVNAKSFFRKLRNEIGMRECGVCRDGEWVTLFTLPEPTEFQRMDLQLKGRTALVTGASQGLGRAIALGMARKGLPVL